VLPLYHLSLPEQSQYIHAYWEIGYANYSKAARLLHNLEIIILDIQSIYNKKISLCSINLLNFILANVLWPWYCVRYLNHVRCLRIRLEYPTRSGSGIHPMHETTCIHSKHNEQNSMKSPDRIWRQPRVARKRIYFLSNGKVDNLTRVLHYNLRNFYEKLTCII